ncbi:hypothetical protein GQ55_8G186300 [Panicum hallii var. hallii]|uniref:Flavin-containing monooxygenase n=1 Tax=Panicum hallii var. hallii TaxID=1504633 RepID=A0A2T7CNX0_9POAL|nr:hypothetical protein GQ55_8G186300 [Panicum hallii var. hallii]
MVSSKKVCVVGAGISGLACARELRREGHDVTVMEQSSSVGGQWLYDPRTDSGDPLGVAGVHSSIYSSVRLLSPREVTGISDFPFYPKNGGDDARRYPWHGEFLRCARAGEVVTEEEVFDAVVVAAGQYTKPRLPTINGMGNWRRRQLHSHSYRVPDSFHQEVVVVVGCHESGKDIALELREVAREVHISVKSIEDVSPGMSKEVSRHNNLHLHPEIDCLCEDGRVVFADGSCVIADAIIYCTGYSYWFPFLDTAGVVNIDDNSVCPLFEHTFPPALAPTLSFVGVAKRVIVPRFYEMQARWVAQVLSGRRVLPSKEEMMRSIEEHNRRATETAGVPNRLTKNVTFNLDYCDEFGEKHCGFPRLEEWKKELIWSSFARLRDCPESFRDDYVDSDVVREGLRSEGWLVETPRVEADGQEDEPHSHRAHQMPI